MSDDEKRRPGHVYDPDNPLPEHLRPAPHSQHQHKLKDVDSVAVAQRIKALGYAGWLGILGMFVGLMIAYRTGASIVLCALLGLVIGTAIALFIGLVIAGRAGSAASTVYMPSGSSTPPVRQYSRAESLIARDRIDDAVAELQRGVAAFPDDAVPRLRLARLLRDRLQRHEDAAAVLKQVIAMRGIDAGVEISASRELIEIYTHRLREPARALPELARLADRHAGSPAAEWAKRELFEIKQAMREGTNE